MWIDVLYYPYSRNLNRAQSKKGKKKKKRIITGIKGNHDGSTLMMQLQVQLHLHIALFRRMTNSTALLIPVTLGIAPDCQTASTCQKVTLFQATAPTAQKAL